MMTPGDLFLENNSIITLLQEGQIKLTGQFTRGSNSNFLALLHKDGQEIQAVYKPVRGENPLWDFPARTLARREVAAYLFSQWLGWNFIPPTVYRRDAPFGAGSFQLYIPHDPRRHYFNLSDADLQRLRPVALFDLAANNADRKGSHLIFDEQDRLWLIDHGLCFNAEDKLRTVIWNFAGEPLPMREGHRLDQARQALVREGDLFNLLHQYLSIAELNAMRRRIRRSLENGVFPDPPTDRRAYPYPPI